ncbi:hypothetical protein M422DRAFT_242250 [Sphaerobolus stellatus SS14]|nr:hypothetical protein M422DRAFT_242250 [Sphaerobolus stellatus SS14]
MKFATIAAALPALAAAHMVPRVAQPTVGAAYFLTNEQSGNFLVSNVIGADGKLSHGEVNRIGGADQYKTFLSYPASDFPSIKVHMVFSAGAVTPGSNSVDAFEIDATNPTKLRLIGQPTNSGGEFPVSVAISRKTGQVCVLNEGKVNGVSCFKQNGAAGLAAVPNQIRFLGLNLTTSTAGPVGSVSQIAFSEDESKLPVAVKGVPGGVVGYIAILDVGARTGSLSQTYTKYPIPTGGLLLWTVTKIPGNNAFVTTDAGVGYNVINFTHNTGAAYPIANQTDSCWTAFLRKTGNAYIVDEGVKTVTEINFDPKNVFKSSIVK